MLKTILIPLLFITSLAFTQPAKKDTKIIVATDTANLINRIAAELYSNGYSVDKKDREVGYIESGEKSFGSYSLKMKAIISDSSVTFTGQIASNVGLAFGGIRVERTFADVFYAVMKSSDFRKAFDTMDVFAKKFGSPTYSK